MQIIPAIDLIDGKCVRLTQGDYNLQKTYQEHPVEMARQFEEAGLTRLHLVDLDGAKRGQVVNWKVLEQIAAKTSLQVDFGGGIHQKEDLQRIFDTGAHWASIGSMAVQKPEMFSKWIGLFGGDRIMLGADVRNGLLAIAGWTQTTSLDIIEFLEHQVQLGIGQVFCTDISRDGLLQGPSTELYRSILAQVSGLSLIASGGVSTLEDLRALRNLGCTGAIVGKAIYEGRISLQELSAFENEIEMD